MGCREPVDFGRSLLDFGSGRTSTEVGRLLSLRGSGGAGITAAGASLLLDGARLLSLDAFCGRRVRPLFTRLALLMT